MIVIRFIHDDPDSPGLVGPFGDWTEAHKYLTDKGYREDQNSIGLWRKTDFSLYEKLARIVKLSKPS